MFVLDEQGIENDDEEDEVFDVQVTEERVEENLSDDESLSLPDDLDDEVLANVEIDDHMLTGNESLSLADNLDNEVLANLEIDDHSLVGK